MTRTVAFIFARGGSKGIPGKNIHPLGGVPLIGWSIDCARRTPEVSRVIVSTDDDEIAATARALGAETPFMRPAELARDNSPELEAWQHAVRWVQAESGPFDVFLSVPTTAPFRAPEDLSQAVRTLTAGDCDLVLGITPSARNPFFNMVARDDQGLLRLASGVAVGAVNRQTAPDVFDITTIVYAARPQWILETTSVLGGRTKGIEIPRERALDIDEPFDLELAEFLLARRAAAEGTP